MDNFSAAEEPIRKIGARDELVRSIDCMYTCGSVGRALCCAWVVRGDYARTDPVEHTSSERAMALGGWNPLSPADRHRTTIDAFPENVEPWEMPWEVA